MTERDLRPYAAALAGSWRDRFGGTDVAVLEGSLLKVDLSGFTRLSERLARTARTGAEEVNAVIDALWSLLIEQVLVRGGDVLQFGGDALAVWFEGPAHGPRAAAAAWAMDRAVRARPAEPTPAGPVRLRMSAGATSGTFVMGLVGGLHRELVVLGPAASEVMRLEALAGSGQVVVGAALGRQLQGAGEAVRWSAESDCAVLTGPPTAPPSARTEPGPAAGAGAFLDLPVRSLQEVGPPGGEHRRATVAFVHLGGLDAAVVRDGAVAAYSDVARVAAAVEQAARRHEVCWLATDLAPDGVVLLVVAGAPIASEHDEERVLRVVREVVDGCPDLPLRAGVHAGRVFAGDVGHPERRTYAVLGDTTNTAARLMAGAGPGEVRVSRDVWLRSDRDHEVAWVGQLSVKGRREAVDAGILGTQALPRHGRVHELALVGRTQEQELLADVVRQVGKGRGSATVLLAAAGEGKSRLVAHAVACAGESGARVLLGSASPYESSTPYAAVRPGLRALLGVDQDEPAAVRRLGRSPLAPLLALPLGLDIASSEEVAALDPSFVGRRRGELLADLLLADGRPLLLVVEDLHLSDRATLDLLDVLALRAADGALAVLTSTRALPDRWPAEPAAWRTVEVAPLDRAAARRLALAAAGERALDDLDLDRLLDEAAGNPLFLTELVAWAGRSDGALPDDVEQVIAARIDELPPTERALLRHAAVLGAEVDLALLGAVLNDVGAVAPVGWEGLDPFLERASGAGRFRHDLYRRVAYQGLAVRQRRRVHAAVAARLAAGPAPDPAALAQHLHAGQDWAAAWEWGGRAARSARHDGALGDSLDLVEQALDAGRRAGVESGTLADAEELLGDVADLLGRYAVADAAYARAGRAGSADRRGGRAVKRAAVVEREGRYRFALSLLTRLEAQLPADDPMRRAALLRRSSTLYRCGRLPASGSAARQVVKLAEQAGDTADRARALLRLEMVASELGLPERFELGRQALEAFAGLDEPRELGNLHVNLGVTCWEGEDWQAALSHYRASGAAYGRAGDRVGQAFATNNAAEVLCDQGRLEQAQAGFEEARRVFRAAGHAFGAAGTASSLGRVAARLGDLDGGRALVEQAREQLVSLGSPVFAADARLRLVEIALLQGRSDGLAMAEAAMDEVRAVGGGAVLPLTCGRYLAVAHLQHGDRGAGISLLRDTAALARSSRSSYEVGCCLDHLVVLGVAGEAERVERDELWRRLDVLAVPDYGLS